MIQTSIPEGDLGTFVDLAIKAKSQKVTSVQFVPPLVVPKHPDFAAIRTLVANAISAAEKPPVSASASSTATSTASSGATKSSTSASATTSGVDAKAVCSAA